MIGHDREIRRPRPAADQVLAQTDVGPSAASVRKLRGMDLASSPRVQVNKVNHGTIGLARGASRPGTWPSSRGADRLVVGGGGPHEQKPLPASGPLIPGRLAT